MNTRLPKGVLRLWKLDTKSSEDRPKGLQAQRFKAYQESHKWLYPEVYGPIEPPAGRNQILTPKDIASICLTALQEDLETAKLSANRRWL